MKFIFYGACLMTSLRFNFNINWSRKLSKKQKIYFDHVAFLVWFIIGYNYLILFKFLIFLNCIKLCSVVLYFIELYCIVLYFIILYCIVLYCIVLYSIILYCIVLFCFVFYYISLFFILFFTNFIISTMIEMNHVHGLLWILDQMSDCILPDSVYCMEM